MDYCRETAKMGEPARSGEAGGPPDRRLPNADYGMRIENFHKSS